MKQKKGRSQQEQTITKSRVAAANVLQHFRPKSHATDKRYNRAKTKRLWQKDQEALCYSLAAPAAA
jgi:hypothetical protein